MGSLAPMPNLAIPGRLAALALLAAPAAAAAQAVEAPAVSLPPDPARCAPEKLFHAVVRNITPGLAASDKAAQPKEIWRLGAIYLRSQEAVDPVSGDQLLTIIAEPDVWMVNIASRKGRHSTDPGPVLEVKAPVLPLGPAGAAPQPLGFLEYGCEPEFVAAFAPAVQRIVPWGASSAEVHTAVAGSDSIVILMDVRRHAPLMVSYVREGRPALVVRYDEWRRDLPPRPQLFEAPRNIQITEQGVFAPASD